jgi:Flp pilus assembly protein TadG
VEFALVAGVLMLIVFGIMVFGVVFSQYQTFQSAAREGARVAAVRGSSAEVVAAANNAAAGYDIGPGTPTADRTCTKDTIGQPVTVSWTQHFDIQLPFLPDMSKNVSIKGTFRCE